MKRKSQEASGVVFKKSKASFSSNDVIALQNRILESTKNVNDLVKLLEYYDSVGDAKNVHSVGSAIVRVFGHLAKNGDMDKDLQGARAQVAEWITDRYTEFMEATRAKLRSTDPRSPVVAVPILMRILYLDSTYLGPHGASKPVVSRATYAEIVRGIIEARSDAAAKELAVTFASAFDDLRYYFYGALAQALSDSELAESKDVAQIVLDMLLDVGNFPQTDADIKTFYMKEKPYVSKTAKKADGDPLLHSSHKIAFEKAWLACLRLKLSISQYKTVLNVLHQKVMPYMARPQMLMDFLTDSYNVGGAISLLALNGLFQLMQTYNLDYPDFFTKLYALLEPSVMHVKYRARFFRLVDLFLSSTHLPATISASFIKRVSRLALFGPPGSVVIAVPFVYNQLKRHPTCMVMIQNADAPAGEADPFKEDEADPLLTDAIKSSLWELETLQSHYHPNVATLARILSQPFNKPRYDLEDFLHHSYKTLMDAERTRRIKGPLPALEFEEFGSVFGNDSGLVQGWSL